MGGYILEGVLTKFDYKPNGRIYDKKGYSIEIIKWSRKVKIEKILKEI